MAGMSLEIGGDASGALGALAATQAAIDALHGKSVEVDVAVNGAGGATDGLGRIKEGSERAGEAHDKHTASLGRNEEALGRHEDALGRASEGAKEHADATERGSESLREHAEESERANDSLNRSAAAHERAAEATRSHTEANNASSSSVNETTAAWDRALSASKAYAEQRAALGGGRGTTEEDAESLRTLGRAYTSARNDLRAQIGDDAFSQQWIGAQLSGKAPTPPAEAKAAGTSSLQREDLPSPSAIQRAEAMESATKRLESAQTQAAATAVQYRKAFDEAFEDAPAGVNATEHARQATADLRGEMTTARNDFRQASQDVSSMEKAFAGAEETGIDLSGMAENMGGALKGVGLGAAVATVGIGLVTAGAAALGGGAALESIKQTPGLMYQAALATRDFDKAFRSMNQESLAAGMPGMKDLQQSMGGLGHIAAQIGADQLPNVLKDVNTAIHDVGSMAQQLEPAMKPAEDAMTSMFGAVTRGIGESAPQITSFANALNASAPQIEQFTHGTIAGMSGLGRLTGDVLDAAAPLVDQVGGALDSTANFVDQHQAAFTATLQQGAKTVGESLLSAVPFLGPALGIADTASTASDAGSAPSGPTLRQATDMGAKVGAHYADTDLPAPWYPDASGSISTTPSTPAQLQASKVLQQQQAGQAPPPVAPPPPDDKSPLTPDQAAKQIQQAHQQVGSSLTLPSPEQAQQLAANLQQVHTASDNAQQSLSQIGQTTTPSLQQAAQSVQTLPQHMQQSLSQLPQQAQQSLAPLQPALQQAMQPPPPPDMAQPVQQATQHAVAQVQQATPQMQSASQDLGSSIPTGTAAGITKDEDVPVTIIRHMIEKIVTEGSDALDSHSPSRVFESLGATIPQGVAVGIQSQASVAVSATQQLMSQVVGVGQAQAVAAQGQLANSGLTGQNGMLSGLTNGINPSALNNNLAALNNYGTGLNQFAGQYGNAYDQLNRRDQDRDKDKDQDKDSPKSLQDIQDEQTKVGRDDPEFKNRGFSDATLRRLEEQKAQHNQRAQQLQEQRAVLHDSAADQARFGRMPEQQLAQLNAQRAAQGEAPLSQQQAQADQWAQKGVGPSWIDQVKADRDAKGQQQGDLAGLGRPSAQAQQAASLQSQAAQVQKQQDFTKAQSYGGLGFLDQLADSTKQKSQKIGQGIPESTADGIRGSQGKSVGAAGDAADAAINEAKKKHGVSSPATVWAGIGANLMAGLAGGIADNGGAVSDALGAVSSGIQATANNNGLQVGYAYSESVVTGMQTVFKQSDFAASAIPQLASAMATTALGQLGDLGPAGGAGQIPKNLQVALSAGVPAQQSQPVQTTVTNTVTIPGTSIIALIKTQIDTAFEDWANAHQQN